MTELTIQKRKNKISNINTYRSNITVISRVGKKPINVIVGENQLNEYQSQFKAKQIIKHYYGKLSEKQLNIIVKNKDKSKLPIISEIEKRLDVIVFRSGFARSIHEARYLIKTGKILTNETIIRKPDYRVKIGSNIKITTDNITAYLARITHIKRNMFRVPSHIVLLKKPKILEAIIVKEPKQEEVYLPNELDIKKFNHYINKYK